MKDLRCLATGAMALLVLLGIVACGSSDSSNPTTTDGGSNPTDSGNTSDSGSDGGSALSFIPSNLDLTGLDLSKVGDIVLSGANCFIQPALDNPGWSCATDAIPKYVMKTITRADQTKMVVYVVKSLRIDPSTVLVAGGGLAGGGGLPFAIVALDKITLLGSIKLTPGYAGGFSNAAPDSTGAGPGGGGGGLGSTKQGGGGASFCGIGGQGGVEMNTAATPYPKSTSYGTPDLIPLVGGSAGGRGLGGGLDNGAGGGAIQLTAGTSIELQAGAFISAPGAGGGQGGLAADQEGAGAGSGGAILLEAPSVKIAGAVAANGGGGGGGAGGSAAGGKSGDVGSDTTAIAASGGTGGGTGGAGDTADGANAQTGVSFTAPGGGGGVGRIRVNTSTGAADIVGATITPSAISTCFSQGTLKK